MSAENTTGVFAERSFVFRDEPGRAAHIRIYRPEPDEDGDWTCKVELMGLDGAGRMHTQEGWGADSAQALFLALELAGNEVKRHKGLLPAPSQGQGEAGPKETSEEPNPWPIRMDSMWLPVPEPFPGEIIAERALEKLTPHGSRPAKVTVYKPVLHSPQEWGCRYVVSGIKDDGSDIKREGYGADSVQALFSALYLIGLHFVHTPAVAEHGHAPWESLPRVKTDDLVPLPLSTKGLGGAVSPPQWLVDLDDGVRALRALRDWLEAAHETTDAPAKAEALVRGMRGLQSERWLPVEDADISRAVRLQAALEKAGNAPPCELLPFAQECLLWWTRASVASRSR